MQLAFPSLPSSAGQAWPARLDQPQLNRCMTLAVLLHILLVLVFGSAPGGTALPGEGVWGSLNVSLVGPRTEPGSGPPSQPDVNVGAVGSAAMQRFGGVVRDENEAPRPDTPGAARQGNWNDRRGEALIGEVAEPRPGETMPRLTVAQPTPTPVIDAARVSEDAVPEVSAVEALPPLQLPEPAPPGPVLRTLKSSPAAQPRPVLATAMPEPVSPVVAEAEPLKPLAPLVLPAPAPVLRSLRAAPAPAPVPLADAERQLSRVSSEPATPALEPIKPLEPVAPVAAVARPQAVEAPRAVVEPAPVASSEAPQTPAPTPAPTASPTPTPTQAPAAAEPVRSVSPERVPSMAPERGAATQAPLSAPPAPSLAPIVGAPDAGARLGRDVATAPSTPASAPRPALNLSLPRGGELSSQGGRGMLQLLPRPPDVKSKLSESIEKAGQADCRNAYSDKGLLALLPLVRDTAKDKGCRW